MIQRARRWCQGWALWRVPRPVLGLVLAVDAAAVVLTVATVFMVDIEISDLWRFAALLACACASFELIRGIELRRSRTPQGTAPYIDASAVWTIAALVALPPALASAMVVGTFVVRGWRIKRGQVVPYRWVYNCATVLVGTQVAVLVLSAGMSNYPGAPLGPGMTAAVDFGIVMVAAAIRWLVNVSLVMVAIALYNPQARVKDLFSNGAEHFLEGGAAVFGIIAAAILVTSPVLMIGVVLVMVALHRGFLVSQLEAQARLDSKTGLAQSGRWHEYATGMLTRARQQGGSIGLLMVDLDHFKTLNDSHGHLFGDQVLKAVAEELLSEIRETDACGRWGGEGFSVVIADMDTAQELDRVAERLRRRIQSIVLEPPERAGEAGASITVTASIGGVLHTPDDSETSLDDLILVADSALYEAKNNGRNTVRVRTTTRTQATADLSTPAQPDQASDAELDDVGRDDSA